MLIDFEISPEEIEKIKELVEYGKYSDIEQFIQISISNMIKREGLRTKENQPDEIDSDYSSYLFSQDVPKIQNISESSNSYNELENEINSFELSKEVKDFEPRPQISTFVTRFFPIKLIMSTIVKHLIVNNKKWFRLEDLEQEVYDTAKIYAKQLKIYEESNGLTRKDKLSTGLPLPESAKKGKKGRAVSRINIKISSSRERFLNQFLGHSGKKYIELKNGERFNEYNFEPGQCMRMGLIGYAWDDRAGEMMLSLTKNGKEFASLNNPIINENKMQSLSTEESKFILKKIIPRFKLEKLITDSILEKFNEKSILDTNSLDDVLEKTKTELIHKNPSIKSEFGIKLFSDVKKMAACHKCGAKIKFDDKEQAQICQKNSSHKVKNPNTPERVAIMGRLAEMGLVEWIIGTKGKSSFKIKK